jgi:hypothetical protein
MRVLFLGSGEEEHVGRGDNTNISLIYQGIAKCKLYIVLCALHSWAHLNIPKTIPTAKVLLLLLLFYRLGH